VEDDTLTVRREFRLRTEHERCSADEFEAMRPALVAAQRDQHALVTLAKDEAEREQEIPKRVAGSP